MSKRNKKKLRKLRRMAMQNRPSETVENVSLPSAQTVRGEESEIKVAKVEAKLQVSPISQEESRHVKKEIRKILLTVLGLVVIIIAISLINTKTDMILKFGTFVADKLNIKI